MQVIFDRLIYAFTIPPSRFSDRPRSGLVGGASDSKTYDLAVGIFLIFSAVSLNSTIQNELSVITGSVFVFFGLYKILKVMSSILPDVLAGSSPWEIGLSPHYRGYDSRDGYSSEFESSSEQRVYKQGVYVSPTIRSTSSSGRDIPKSGTHMSSTVGSTSFISRETPKSGTYVSSVGSASSVSRDIPKSGTHMSSTVGSTSFISRETPKSGTYVSSTLNTN